jgi:pimeloyl-ACP methyl ester carboxylesterase
VTEEIEAESGERTFVLVHGCYQGGWIWKLVASRLRAAGHTVLAPSLDGCGERASSIRPGIDTESHAEEIANLLVYEDLRDVVLVGTSTGGMTVAKAAELRPDRIARLVFVDAIALQDGTSVQDVVASPPQAHETHVSIGPSAEQARDRTFAGLEPQLRDWALERITLHPAAVIRNPVRLGDFWQREWDATVIWCRRSSNPGEAHQRDYATRLKAAWYELDTGHYPMLSAPDSLVELLFK